MFKKVHRFLTFLDFKVGVYFNLRFQMQETDELNVTPPLSPSYERGPGCILCQICFTDCLKKNVKREKREKKYLILNISKKHHYAGKTVVMDTKGYMHLLIGKKGKNWRIKPAKEHSLRKVFLFQKRKKLQL